ncbi:MAG: hypothetical protein GY769_24345 [bacterium]|nr:hypothetical protein [bacterium]
MKTKRYFRLALLLPLVALVLAGCPKSPEERVAKLRTYYKARVIGIIVDAVPAAAEVLEEEMVEGEGEMPMTETEDAPAAAIEPEVEAVAAVPTLQTVRVDILIQHDSPEKLPGITLDLEMVDAQEVLKDSWKVWVDTSELPKATGSQFTHVLEDIDYAEGDGFSVDVRSYVPPEERGQYKEFAGLGG